MTLGSILTSYIEQIHTTFETMRRRGLVAYDSALKFIGLADNFCKTLPNQYYKLLESGLYKNAVAHIRSESQLDARNNFKRHSLQEFYFGISILIIGMCAGEMTGVLWSPSILSIIPGTVIKIALILVIPIYSYLHLKQKIAHTVEHRSWLFGMIFLDCMLLGDLVGKRLLWTNPSLFFLMPFVIALMVDTEFSPPSLYSNRIRLLSVALVGSFFVMESFAVISGMVSFVSTLAFILQCLLTAIHFQIAEACISESYFVKAEVQLVYVFGLVLIQILLSSFFGLFIY